MKKETSHVKESQKKLKINYFKEAITLLLKYKKDSEIKHRKSRC